MLVIFLPLDQLRKTLHKWPLVCGAVDLHTIAPGSPTRQASVSDCPHLSGNSFYRRFWRNRWAILPLPPEYEKTKSIVNHWPFLITLKGARGILIPPGPLYYRLGITEHRTMHGFGYLMPGDVDWHSLQHWPQSGHQDQQHRPSYGCRNYALQPQSR